jgi:hypothetical protein
MAGTNPLFDTALGELCQMKITGLSGDSSVSEVGYVNGAANCLFEDYDTGERYRIRVPTRWFYSETSAERGTVHLRLIRLCDRLPCEPRSGRYPLPQDFPAQMDAAREEIVLAVGLRADEWPLFLQVRGYKILLACPVASEDSVSVESAS